jgi:hypothetical protein
MISEQIIGSNGPLFFHHIAGIVSPTLRKWNLFLSQVMRGSLDHDCELTAGTGL